MDAEKENTVKHINDIINHLIKHFEYEEKVLLQIGYEGTQNHKKIHNHLLVRVQEIKNAVEIGSMDYINAFAHIFDEVIVGHLLFEDVNFYPCFQAKEKSSEK